MPYSPKTAASKKFRDPDNAHIAPPFSVKDNLAPAQVEAYAGKTLDELVSIMTEENKIDVAASLMRQIQTGDASAFKIVSNILERQGVNLNQEIPISDQRFNQIIKIMAEELVFRESSSI